MCVRACPQKKKMQHPTAREVRDSVFKVRAVLLDPAVDSETKRRYGQVYADRKTSRFQHDAKGREVDIDPQLDMSAVNQMLLRVCVFCGLEFAGGVDRFSNPGGYFLPNMRPCCVGCNRAKGGLHGTHFVAHAHRVTDFQAQRVGDRDGRRRLADFGRDAPPPPRCAWTAMMRRKTSHHAHLVHLTTEERKRRAFERWKSKSLRRYRRNKAPEDLYCTLTLGDWMRLVSAPCVFCGEAPAHGVDRIHDADRGYSPEGTQSCCLTCNFVKGAVSNAEMIERMRSVAENNPYDPAVHDAFVGVTSPTPDNYYFVDAAARTFQAVDKESEEFISEKRSAESPDNLLDP